MMPVKVVIVRREPDDKMDDIEFKRKGQTPPQLKPFVDQNMNNKIDEFNRAEKGQKDKDAKQPDSKRNTFGASGIEELKTEEIRSKIEMHRAITKKAEQI